MANSIKYFYLFSITLAFFACNNKEYKIDFSKIPFPDKEKIANSVLDSILKDEEDFYRSFDSLVLSCKTDKMSYQMGEKINLTIQNKTDESIYFFPDEKEGERNHLLFFQYDKEGFKKNLVSQNPAIYGYVYYTHPNFISLSFAGIDQFTSDELGLDHFDEVLKPGKTMIFNITIPKRSGYYRFMIKRFSHETDGIGVWGLNNFILSNTFQILEE